jgi:hypothetical protein
LNKNCALLYYASNFTIIDFKYFLMNYTLGPILKKNYVIYYGCLPMFSRFSPEFLGYIYQVDVPLRLTGLFYFVFAASFCSQSKETEYVFVSVYITNHTAAKCKCMFCFRLIHDYSPYPTQFINRLHQVTL